jgi:hypothetical protein
MQELVQFDLISELLILQFPDLNIPIPKLSVFSSLERNMPFFKSAKAGPFNKLTVLDHFTPMVVP